MTIYKIVKQIAEQLKDRLSQLKKINKIIISYNEEVINNKSE